MQKDIEAMAAPKKQPGEKSVKWTFSFPPSTFERLGILAEEQSGGNRSLMLQRLVEAAWKLKKGTRLDELVQELLDNRQLEPRKAPK